MIISGLLSWSFDNRILGDISIRFYPAGIQLYAMLFGILAVILGVLLLRRPPWMSPARGLRILGITATRVRRLGARLDRRTRPVA